ncbi:hypothetical protein SAMN04490248_12625 [Salinihabitans flavidus]|uniref:PAS domain-containing protein n=1 Tax=Salinihabitans flavidus TaxID=569882 RepID=A0A1H8V847_9RHOB|nr:PAS domain-containing protein [Salinihabitans flavidus]SEP11531.1 hypothetical protein SAMN04490248_12625 [Salinihabitans flavidus]
MSGGVEFLSVPVLSQVEGYWDALREGRDMPLRSEVDPRGIQGALAHAFILERIAPGMTRIRVAGSVLNNVMGMEVRGMPFSALFTVGARKQLAALCDRVLTTPARARIALSAETGFGRGPLDGQLLLLPLRSDLGDISRMIGCLSLQGMVGTTSRRFDIVHSTLTPLGALRPDAGMHTPAPHRAPVDDAPSRTAVTTGTAEESGGHGSERPYLRLVVTGE